MKKFTTLLTSMVLTIAVFAQASFIDDFESYNVNDFIGSSSATWTTWSGNNGGADDVQVSNGQALSGSNSIYFNSTVTSGGPDDVVLPFGGTFNTGSFTYEGNFYVDANTGAYFNFQGDMPVGQSWVLHCYVDQNGNLRIENSQNITVGSTTINHDSWFSFKVEIELNTNDWEVFIDNVSIAKFTNINNQVAAQNLFPLNASTAGGNDMSSFYVDDVSYSHVPYSLPSLNAAVSAATNVSPSIAGQELKPMVNVRNLGTMAITSFDLTLNYNGNQTTENFSSLNIASGDDLEVEWPNIIELVAGLQDMTFTISNVNGLGNDNDPNDDAKIIPIDPVVPAIDKAFLAEEATGTWCQWCPRGAVFMDRLYHKYGDLFIPVAVHSGDPMEDNPYNDSLNAVFSPSYPRAFGDRASNINPNALESDFLSRIVLEPAARLENGGNWNSATRELTVSLRVDWTSNQSGDWRMAVIITEDSVTGTTAGYAQINAYAGGGEGKMGGYELLPNPVPANQMVYDHVARGISPSFHGLENSFPASVDAFDEFTRHFKFTLDADWEEDKMHVIGILIEPNGQINNALTSTFSEITTRGIRDTASITSVPTMYFDGPDLLSRVFPNPASDQAVVSLNLRTNSDVDINIYNLMGQIVGQRSYGELNGAYQLPINTSQLASGNYIIEVSMGTEVERHQLVVE